MKHLNESMQSVTEARVRDEEHAIEVIVECLEDNGVLDDLCAAADKGTIDIRSFTEAHGQELLNALNEALTEWWNDNY